MESGTNSIKKEKSVKSELGEVKKTSSVYKDSKVSIHEVLSDKTGIGSDDHDEIQVIGNFSKYKDSEDTIVLFL